MTLTPRQMQDVMGFALTDEQWAAVSSPVEPAVIIAGAGSGKTTCMAARVAYLVADEIVRPDQVLGLTFTRKATGRLTSSMRDALRGLDNAGLSPMTDDDLPPAEPQVMTYHSFCSHIVEEHGIRLGIEPGVTMLSNGASEQRVYRLITRSSLPLGRFGKSPMQLTSMVLDLDGQLAEMSIAPDALRSYDLDLVQKLNGFDELQADATELRDTAAERALLVDLVQEWRRDKLARHEFDFADQARLALDLMRRYPEIVNEVRGRFGVVLLDEYQDTSLAQRMLLQAAFGDGHPVLAVGDPFQAIYGWRAASVSNIEDFPEHCPVITPAGPRPAAVYPLSQNRRSGPRILDVTNHASHSLRDAHPRVQPLTPGQLAKGPGHVTCALFETQRDEVDWVVHQIEATHRGGVPWRSIAVLGAVNASLVTLDRALRARSIPTQHIGAAALLAQPAVVDLRAMLELIHEPTANPSFIRVAAGPRWGIGPRDLAALGDRASYLAGRSRRGEQADIAHALDEAVAGIDVVDSVSLVDTLDDLGPLERYSPEAVDRFSRLSREIHELRRHGAESPSELLMRVIRTTGLDVEIAVAPPDVREQQQRALAALLDLAADVTDLDGHISLGGFLARLRDAERFDISLDLDDEGEADAVQLITMHKAKGLEYPYVFVPFMCKGTFPSGQSRPRWTSNASVVPWDLREDGNEDLCSYPDLSESPKAKDYTTYKSILKSYEDLDARRLAYVALTRAERGLVVTGHWWGPSQVMARGPHEILTEVHHVVSEGAGTVGVWAPAPENTKANPYVSRTVVEAPWPVEPDSHRIARLREVADAVRDLRVHQPQLEGLVVVGDAEERRWDEWAAALIDEARRMRSHERTVRLPESVSASLLMRALDHPDDVARDIVRPMPQAPAPAARRGTSLHAWIESRFGQQTLFDPDDLPGAADADIGTDEALQQLKTAFEAGPFSRLAPVAIEEPFALLLGGRVINGRIDAVFEEHDMYDVVDWKTGSARNLHSMQLAIYRVAWAQLRGIPVERVTAGFAMIATGEMLRPDTDDDVARLLALGARLH